MIPVSEADTTEFYHSYQKYLTSRHHFNQTPTKNINIFIFIHYPFQPYTHLNASLMGQQALVAATSPSAYISQVWIDHVILFFHHHHHCPRHRHHHHHHQHWHRPPQQMTAGLPTMAHSGTNPGINGLASTIVTPTSGLSWWRWWWWWWRWWRWWWRWWWWGGGGEDDGDVPHFTWDQNFEWWFLDSLDSWSNQISL